MDTLKGREAVEAYRTAHQDLHNKPWTPDVPDKHTPLLDKLNLELKVAGFVDMKEFFAATQRLEAVEYTAYLLNLLSTATPLRFIDVSNLDSASYSALHEILLKLRLEDKIPDTLFYRYLDGGKEIAYFGKFRDPSIVQAFRRRCEQFGVKDYRCVIAGSVMFFDDVVVRLVTKNKLADAWESMLSILVKTLFVLGVEVSVQPQTNNISISGKKLAQGIKRIYSDVNFIGTCVFRDFDYDVGAVVFDEPDIRDKITTLKEILGREIPYAEYKSVYLQSCRHVFSNIQEDSLSTEEQTLLTRLLPKYESEAWNDLGQTDDALVKIEEVIDGN